MKKILFGAAAAASLSLLVWAAWPAAPGASSPQSALPALLAAGPARAPASARQGCALQPGATLGYSLSIANELRLQAALAAQAGTGTVANTVSASLALEVLETTESGAVLLARFVDVAAPPELHAEELTAPFLVELNQRCELTRFARQQRATLAGARTQQALAWELSWRWANGQESVTRENARGVFTAVAAMGDDRGARVAQHSVQRYERLWEGQPVVSVSGLTSVRPGDGPWFDTLDGDETLVSSAVTSRTRVRATRAAARDGLFGPADRERAQYTWEDLLPKRIERREARPVTAQDRQRREAVKDQTPAEAVGALAGRLKEPAGIAGAWPPLAAYLEARPEQTEAVVNEMKGGGLETDVLNVVYIALGNARTPEASAALHGIMRDAAAPPQERARAMFALVDRPDVGAPLAEELARQSSALTGTPTRDARFVASEALLAVTTMSGLHEEPDVRRIAEGSVRAVLQPNSPPTSQGTALRALANLGDASLLPLALPYTSSPSEDVRKAATRVIRRMKPADTEAFVADWVAREPSDWVKRELFFTLELQHHDAEARLAPQLTTLLLRELQSGHHAVLARKSLIRLLGSSSQAETPELRAALKAQARLEFPKRNGLFEEVLLTLTPEEIREVAP